MNLVVFIINPVLYVFCRIINYKTFLKEKKEYFFALSLAIINTYIPYNAGDSIRYAFKYYEIMLYPIKEAWNIYLPHQDYIYYGILFLFSRLKIPYNIFIIFTSFVMFYIILSLLNNLNIKNKICVFFILYNPIIISLEIRFPLANYLSLYCLMNIKKSKKYFLLLILAFFIHKSSCILIIVYFLSIILPKFIKITVKKIFFLFLICNYLYIKISLLYIYFPDNYIIKKLYNYSQNNLQKIVYDAINNKLGYMWIINFFAFIIFYIFLLKNIKKLKQKKYFYFLIFLGTIIISFSQILIIPLRFSWIFNTFFILFLVENNIRLKLWYKLNLIIFVLLNIVILIYYSTIFYIRNYNSIPQIIYPTIIQVIGIDNMYNKKIKNIVNNYPEKKQLGNSLMADLKKYY